MAKILIIDDSETARVQLRSDLESAGYSVIEASGGEEGLRVFKAESEVSLVICDMVMPDVDGLMLSENIRSISKTIPIFMITGAAKAEVLNRSRLINVGLWIFKPYSRSHVLSEIESALLAA